MWKIQLSLNNAVSTATEMSPETMMFGYALPMRATTLIQLDCTTQQENEGGTPRLPLRIRANQVKDMAAKQQSQLDKRNDKLRNNHAAVSSGDLVLKQVVQHSTVGAKHLTSRPCPWTATPHLLTQEAPVARRKGPESVYLLREFLSRAQKKLIPPALSVWSKKPPPSTRTR